VSPSDSPTPPRFNQPLGGDEVPDPHGTSALAGANLAFEMLCVMPGVVYRS